MVELRSSTAVGTAGGEARLDPSATLIVAEVFGPT